MRGLVGVDMWDIVDIAGVLVGHGLEPGRAEAPRQEASAAACVVL